MSEGPAGWDHATTYFLASQGDCFKVLHTFIYFILLNASISFYLQIYKDYWNVKRHSCLDQEISGFCLHRVQQPSIHFNPSSNHVKKIIFQRSTNTAPMAHGGMPQDRWRLLHGLAIADCHWLGALSSAKSTYWSAFWSFWFLGFSNILVAWHFIHSIQYDMQYDLIISNIFWHDLSSSDMCLGENLRDEIHSVFIARWSCFLQLRWDKWAMVGHHNPPVSTWTNGFQSVSSSFSRTTSWCFSRSVSVSGISTCNLSALGESWVKLASLAKWLQWLQCLQWLQSLQRQCGNANVMKMEATCWWYVASSVTVSQCHVALAHCVYKKHWETMPLDVVGSWLSNHAVCEHWPLNHHNPFNFFKAYFWSSLRMPLFAPCPSSVLVSTRTFLVHPWWCRTSPRSCLAAALGACRKDPFAGACHLSVQTSSAGSGNSRKTYPQPNVVAGLARNETETTQFATEWVEQPLEL